MDSVAQIINGQNGPMSLILLAGVVAFIIYAFKCGKISYKGHGLTVGETREAERRIVREQIQYMERTMDGVFTKLPENFQINECYKYACKYWFSVLKDFLETMIIYNHLREDSIYIELKQESAYNLMLSVVDSDAYWKSPEFRGLIYNTVGTLIKDLIKVRVTYEATK